MSRLPVFIATVLALCAFSASAHEWPQWMGPNRDGLTQETGLLKSWPNDGPERVWLFDNCGDGYAGPAIAGDKLYILGTRDDKCHMFCLDSANGSELWNVEIGDIFTNKWGDGPRATPTLDAGHVYAIGARGTLVCLQADSGEEVWRTKMQDLGGKIPVWGYSESVLIDGDKLICTPGGKEGAIVALDKQTGSVIWQCKDLDDEAHYSSIIKVAPSASPQYVQLLDKRLVGLSTDDGALLWEIGWPGRVATVPTPLYHDGFVYCTSGYGSGCMLVKLNPDNTSEEVYRNRTMKNHHGGAIRVGDYVYGHSDGVGWVCQDFKSGERIWRERSELGKGAIGYADGMLYLLDEKAGDVVLIEATSVGWNEQGRFALSPHAANRSPSGGIWVHPVIVNGRLYLRDQEFVYCYDVKE